REAPLPERQQERLAEAVGSAAPAVEDFRKLHRAVHTFAPVTRSRPPSMSVAVKPLQAFFLVARTDHAAGRVPISRRLPALLPSILAPPPSPQPRRGEDGGARMLLAFPPTRRPRPCRPGASHSWPLACASVP